MIERVVTWRKTLGIIDALAPPAVFAGFLPLAHLRSGLLGGTFLAFLCVRSVVRSGSVLRDAGGYRFDAMRVAIVAAIVLVFDLALLLGNGPVGTAWSAGDRVGMISVDGRLSDVRLRSDGS